MKSTKVQNLGELCMRGTANWWAGLLVCIYSCSPASSLWRVWHGLATAVDSMRESIHALRCDFLRLRDKQRERTGRGKPVLISIIGLLTWFSCHNSRTQYFNENRHFKNEASVALNLLVSLFGRFVACGSRNRGNRQTDTQTKYCNPRCACAPRVNK